MMQSSGWEELKGPNVSWLDFSPERIRSFPNCQCFNLKKKPANIAS